jgi:hypothetical protein
MTTSHSLPVIVIAVLLLSSQVLAATPQEARCLSLLDVSKQAEAKSRAAHALWQSQKTEANRCDFLRATKSQFHAVKTAGEACAAFQPEETRKAVADANEGLRAISSSGCKGLK